TFASTTLPALDPGLSWRVVYAPTSVSLSVVAGLQGDFNSNGRVDAGDYVVWRNSVGSTAALPNDSIGGTVGAGPYSEWKSHLGQTRGSGSGEISTGGMPVPEPASIAFAIMAAICVLSDRRAVSLRPLSLP